MGNEEQRGPYLYECMICGHKLTGDVEPKQCPNCGETMKNVSMPSANPGLTGPSY